MNIARIISLLLKQFRQSSNQSLGLWLLSVGIAFVVSILLARLLGVSGFGTYAYAVMWAYLLSVLATMGCDSLLTRELALYRARADWALMRGLLNWADSTVVLVSTGLAVVAILVIWSVSSRAELEPIIALCIAIALVQVLAFRNLRRGALQGLNRPINGLLPELLIAPLILIVLTIGTDFVLRVGWERSLSPLWAIGLYGVSAVVTLILVRQALGRSLPKPAKTALPKYQSEVWLKGALLFWLVESLPVVNTQIDVLMLGAMQGVETVGLYVPIKQGAQLIPLILIIVSRRLAPTMAGAYADSRVLDLQQLITKRVRLISGIAFLLAATLIVCGPQYLSLFGLAFVGGHSALSILCIGSFISTAVGLSLIVLNATGHQRHVAIIGGLTIALNTVLNAVCIPRWGLEGAALASSISVVLGGFIGLLVVRQTLGIDATLMGLPVSKAIGK